MGTALRQRYEGFLDSSYHYSIIEGTSSSYARAKESLQLILAGLFPPTQELLWSEDLNWLPIATYFDKKPTDMVIKIAIILVKEYIVIKLNLFTACTRVSIVHAIKCCKNRWL